MSPRDEEASLLRDAFEKSLPVSLGLPIGLLVLRWMYNLSYSIPIGVYAFAVVLGVIYFLISRPPLRLKIARYSFYAIVGFLIPIAMMPMVLMMIRMTDGKADEITWQEPLIGFGAFALLIALTRGSSQKHKNAEQGACTQPSVAKAPSGE